MNNKINYCTDKQAKETILEIGCRMYEKNYIVSNDGNISCKVDENTFWITPTGVSKGFMKEDMLIKMDIYGNVLEGNKPSSETKMHLRVYNENPLIAGVVHAHPLVATSFAIAGIPLDLAILPEAVVNLGSVPVAKYATPGTQDVPESIAPFCKEYNAVLLENHGVLTWGENVMQAYYRLETVEYYAKILMTARQISSQLHVLNNNQVEELMNIRAKLGIKSGGIPKTSQNNKNNENIVKVYHTNQ